SSGKRASADILATDHSRLLVLLKAHDVNDLPVPEIVPLAGIQVGQWAIAVGRAFRADVPNVSVGIISATSRIAGRAIQTDAAVSMANYGGPLVDVQGRVLGVLVPMSPQEGDVAGIEWYDSGIGFAVPLAAISSRIDEMKSGKDQFPGRLGVSLKAGNPFTTPAELAAARPNSPAGKAGLKKGDRIVAVEGIPVETQRELRLVLGPRYAGESVALKILRGEEQLERQLTLAGELEVFRHAALGIFPERSIPPKKDDKEPQHVKVRAVVPGSPAEAAGIRPGDAVTLINNEAIGSVGDAIEKMNFVAVGDPVAVRVRRGLRVLVLSSTAGPCETAFANLDLPPQSKAPGDAVAKDAVDAKPEKLQLPEFAHQCEVYAPAGADK
ncbi:MAG: PDZ domain-containing protein, partial [Pirellulaceae bacterium]